MISCPSEPLSAPWRDALDAVSAYVFVADDSGLLVYANHSAQVMLGRRALLGRPVRELLEEFTFECSSRVVQHLDQRFDVFTCVRHAQVLEVTPLLKQLAVELTYGLAEVAVLDVRSDNGGIVRAAHACREPALEPLADSLATGAEVLASEERSLSLHADSGSMLGLPLRFDGELLAAVTLVRTQRMAPFSDTDIHLAEDVASRAAQSMSNARRYEAARRAVDQRNQTLKIVAHDLRGPLSACAMAAQHLTRSLPAELDKPREIVEAIRRAALRGGKLIDDLLQS